jgi:hypothetical protein
MKKSVFSEPFHAGVVVKDLDEAVKHLSALGFGPFEAYHGSLGVVPPVKRKLRGKPADCDLKIMAADMGPIKLELIQPSGECIHSEFLNSKGEGLHHLGFYVDELDKEVEELAKEGMLPVFESTAANGKFCAYYEPEGAGGIIMELVRRPK